MEPITQPTPHWSRWTGAETPTSNESFTPCGYVEYTYFVGEHYGNLFHVHNFMLDCWYVQSVVPTYKFNFSVPDYTHEDFIE